MPQKVSRGAPPPTSPGMTMEINLSTAIKRGANWQKQKNTITGERRKVWRMRERGSNTVCQSAHLPNRAANSQDMMQNQLNRNDRASLSPTTNCFLSAQEWFVCERARERKSKCI